MKTNSKISASTLLISLMAFSASSYANVAQSGKWSEASTWSEGAVPAATSASAPYTSFIFDKSDITFEVDSNQFVDCIDLANAENTVINIDSGSTFTIRGRTSPKSIISSTLANNTLTFGGEGSLVIGSAGISDAPITNTNITFNVDVKSGSSWGNLFYFSSSSVLNINKKFDMQGCQVNASNGVFNINAGASLIAGYIISYGKFNLNVGATAKSGSALISNGNFNGSLTLTGVRDYANEKFAAQFTTVSFGADSSFASTSTDARAIVLFKDVNTSSAKANALKIAGKTYLQNSSSLILKSSNAFNTEGATSQGASNFNIVHYRIDYNWTTQVRTEYYESSKATITLGADNDFGKFTFANGSVLTFNGNGHKSVIGGIGLFTTDAVYSMVLNNLTDFTIKINSLENITVSDFGEGKFAEEITYVNGEFSNNVFLVEDTVNGGWWLNTTVPEPSEVAAIFGALALAFAAFSKSKKNRK